MHRPLVCHGAYQRADSPVTADLRAISMVKTIPARLAAGWDD